MDSDLRGLDYLSDGFKAYLKPGFFIAILIWLGIGTWFLHAQPTALPSALAAVITSSMGAWMQRRRIRALTDARRLEKRPGPLAGATLHWVVFFFFGIVLMMVSTLVPKGFEEYVKYNVLDLSYPAAAAWSSIMVALLAWQFWPKGRDAFAPHPWLPVPPLRGMTPPEAGTPSAMEASASSETPPENREAPLDQLPTSNPEIPDTR